MSYGPCKHKAAVEKKYKVWNFDALEFQGRYAPLILAPVEGSSPEPYVLGRKILMGTKILDIHTKSV